MSIGGTFRTVIGAIAVVAVVLIVVPVAYWPIALAVLRVAALCGVVVLFLRRRH